ncbi:SDR family NAD(P)-dependent oxidoreductase [Pirellulaceae bacterium SH449]
MSFEKVCTKYGPWAVVTGASSGIGRALATELARAKINVVLVGRSVTELDRMAGELSQAQGVECRVVMFDLSDENCIDVLQRATSDLDVGLLVASAGFGTSGSFVDNPIEPELEMLNVNCRALMTLSWYFSRRFVKRGSGGLILLSSIVAFQGTPWAAHYAATKAYVQVLAEGLGRELRPKGVDVLAVAPGPTNTGFASRANMTMAASLDPDKIAPEIITALGRKSTLLPGFLSKLLVYAMLPLPRWARISIMGTVMRGMSSNK